MAWFFRWGIKKQKKEWSYYMKIAIDALPLLGHAGGKVFLQQLINALFDYDKDNEYNLVFRKYNLDLKKYRLKFTNQNNIKIDKILMPNRIMEYFWTFNEFNFLKGDTLYNNSDIFLSLLYFFPIFKKTKTVSILYDITTLKIDEYGSHKKEFMIRMNNLIKRSDKIVAISEFTKKDFCQYFNYPERNVDVVYPTVDLSFKVLDRNKVENMIKKYNLNFREYFIYVGNISYHKNIDRLITAFLKLKYNGKKLVLCGRTNWGKNIVDRIRKDKISDKVMLLENVNDEDLPFLYNGSISLCYVSLYEGFGLPILEAMKCGRPVIVSNLTSMPEVVSDAGITVNPYDETEIASKMEEILNIEKNEYYSRKSLERANFFDQKKLALSMIDIFNKVV